MCRLYFKYAVSLYPYKPQPYQAWSTYEYNIGHNNEARKIYATGIKLLLQNSNSSDEQRALYILNTWALMERVYYN